MSNHPKSSTAAGASRAPSRRRSLGSRLLLVLTLATACDRSRPSPSSDTTGGTSVPTLATDSTRPPIGTGWASGAGPFLVLPTVDGGHDAGSLLRPEANDSTVGDTAGLRSAPGAGTVELFSRAALLGEARLAVEKGVPIEAGCTAWPVARLSASSGVLPHGWTAAFVKGHVTSVPLDSIEGLSPKDSAALAVNIARLASGLADDSVATFRGLPFVVLRAFRGGVAGQSFVVTMLVRRVNQEDSPMEERLVMVIDGEQSQPSAWTVGWHERAAGREEELVVSEPLLAFQVAGQGAPHLLFGRDDGEALSAALLVRHDTGWKVLWESALAGCEH